VSVQATREDFCVRGDSAPVWLLIGITLAGLVGNIITAGLLLPNSADGSHPRLPRIGTTLSTTQMSPPLADDPDAKLGEENNRPQVETDAELALEQFPAELGTSDTPGPDTVASGLEVVAGSASGVPAPRSQAMQQLPGEQLSIRQAAPGLAPGADEGSPLAGETNETPDGGESAPPASFPADAAKSGLQSTGTETHRDAALEQTVDEITSDCAPLFPIRFKHGSFKPQVEDMKQKIERLAAWLNAHPTATLNLDGHADASGPEEYNLVLSFRRAAAVAALLEGAGTSKTQLVVRAYGEGQSSSHSAEPAFERRVALMIDAGTPCDDP